MPWLDSVCFVCFLPRKGALSIVKCFECLKKRYINVILAAGILDWAVGIKGLKVVSQFLLPLFVSVFFFLFLSFTVSIVQHNPNYTTYYLTTSFILMYPNHITQVLFT